MSATTIISIHTILVREYDDFEITEDGDIRHKIVPRDFARVVGGYTIADLSDKTRRVVYLDTKCLAAVAQVSPAYSRWPEEVHGRTLLCHALITLAKEGIFRA